MNRKPKDYKRNARGSTNFDYTRNHILWATRIKPAMRSSPKTHEEIHSYETKNTNTTEKEVEIHPNLSEIQLLFSLLTLGVCFICHY